MPSSLLEPSFLLGRPLAPDLSGSPVFDEAGGRCGGASAASSGSGGGNSAFSSCGSSCSDGSTDAGRLPAPQTTLSRTKSLFSLPSTVSTSLSSSLSCEEERGGMEAVPEPAQESCAFASDVQDQVQRRRQTSDPSSQPVAFDADLRRVLEPHLRRARLRREKCRSQVSPNSSLNELVAVHRSIADSVGLPYTSLRIERAFLFDEHTHPLHRLLADALQVDDLSLLRQLQNDGHVLAPLRNPRRCHAFHAAYDHFVTSFCIPLIHSLAMTQNVFYSVSASDQITYRYQAFPTIRVAFPGQPPQFPPTCGSAQGYSLGCLHFAVPLTPSSGPGDAVAYVESHPGREDWHPLHAKSFGLGYLYDGSRCLSFDLGNPSATSARVSLHFAVLLYRDYYGTHMAHDAGLCPEDLLDDALGLADPNYYEEAVIDLGQRESRRWSGTSEMVSKKSGPRLLPPSYLLGPPFGPTPP